ncbi:MAG: hypothetical protein LBU12_09575 [Deltaproteobacteria bacterium]|nr:hypothetical protein [Deltaproteobacteria bacterium]
MRKAGASGLRFLKIIHLITASLWLGGATALVLLIGCLGAQAESGDQLTGFNLAAKLVDDLVVIPGAMGCLLTGLLLSLFTHWGFFKQRWVAVKWLVTVGCILFGTFFLGPLVNGQPLISAELGLSALSDPAYLAARLKNLAGGLVQAALLIFLIYISVRKPWRGAKRLD